MQAIEVPEDLAEMPPGPELGALLAGLDLARVANDDTVPVLRAQYRQVAHEQARLLSAIVEVGRSTPFSDPEDPYVRALFGVQRSQAVYEWASAELAAALTLTSSSADRELGFAETVVTRLPLVLAALRAGSIDRAKAWVFAEYLEGDLTAEQVALICARTVPRASRWTTGQLRARLARMIHDIDPGHARRRYARAVRGRAVVGHLSVDGTVAVTATGLPIADAAVACARLDALSEAVQRAGHPGRLAQIQTDLFLGMLDGSFHHLTEAEIIAALLRRSRPEDAEPADTRTPAADHRPADVAGSGPAPRPASGGPPTSDSPPNDSCTGDPSTDGSPATGGPSTSGPSPTGRSTAGPSMERPGEGRLTPRAGVEVRVGLATLIGLDERCGEIPELGPVVPDAARALVDAQTRGAEWRFAVTDPDGHLILAGTTRRRPAAISTDPSSLGRRTCRGGVVELHIDATLLTRLAAGPGTCGNWAAVVLDIAAQYAAREDGVALLDHRPRARFARAALARHVEIRDRTCCFPGCRRPARRSDKDHTPRPLTRRRHRNRQHRPAVRTPSPAQDRRRLDSRPARARPVPLDLPARTPLPLSRRTDHRTCGATPRKADRERSRSGTTPLPLHRQPDPGPAAPAGTGPSRLRDTRHRQRRRRMPLLIPHGERPGLLRARLPGPLATAQDHRSRARPEESSMTAVWNTPLTPLAFLRRSAEVFPDRTAIVYDDRRQTYAEFAAEATRVAHALRGSGVRPGDRVAYLLPNVPEMLVAHFAVPLAGAVLVAINTRLSTEEVRYILDHAGAKVLVVDSALYPTVAPVAAGLKTVEEIITVVDPAAPGDGIGSGITYVDLLARGKDDQLSWGVADETACISINYTSGTTGRPKGVQYSHRGAHLNSFGEIVHSGHTFDSVYLWTLPMFHCNGWCTPWAVTAIGGTHVCLREVRGDVVWRLIGEHGVTHLNGAPTVVTAIMRAPEAVPLDRPITITTAGAPPSPTTIGQAERMGFRIVHVYGLTETYGPYSVNQFQQEWTALAPEERAARQARQGVGMMCADRLRVVDPEMADVPADGTTMGEVVMRGNNVMLGYYDDAAATEKAFEGDWFHSGDLGVMHPDGYLELRDRAKDVVVSGGENISTIEVEQAVVSHPAVLEAAVIGVPDEQWGERPKAFVVLVEGESATPEELIEHVKSRIARYKAPKAVEFVDALPKTSTGKVQKFELREQEWAGETRRIQG